ncbi:hypothetical protein [Archangium sp.]|uniref:hypothetical protein n=1 Tax=Archangium sp. TaxID=1872627 RepID=UPI002ED7A225
MEADGEQALHTFIELHDSELAGVRFEGGDAILGFSSAYLHKKTAELAGRAHITGWLQRAELVIQGAAGTELPTHGPGRIDDGVLTLGERRHPNVLPIPLAFSGEVRLELEVRDEESRGWMLVLEGQGARLTLLGEPEYCEESSLRLRDDFRVLSRSEEGRVQVFQNPRDGTYWRLTYPEKGRPGVGTPDWAPITEEEARSHSRRL